MHLGLMALQIYNILIGHGQETSSAATAVRTCTPFAQDAPLVTELMRPLASPGRAGRSDRPGSVYACPIAGCKNCRWSIATSATAVITFGIRLRGVIVLRQPPLEHGIKPRLATHPVNAALRSVGLPYTARVCSGVNVDEVA